MQGLRIRRVHRGLPGRLDLHGQFTTIYSRDSYAIALDHLADQMASEMMIDYFVPPDAPPSSDTTVGVRVPGAVVSGLGVR